MDGLPVESLTLTRMRDQLTPEDRARLDSGPHAHGQWSRAEMLLAAGVDAVNRQTWVLAEWAKGKRPPPPTPIPRPGVEDAEQGRQAPVAALKARVSDRTWAVAEALRNGLPIPPPERDDE